MTNDVNKVKANFMDALKGLNPEDIEGGLVKMSVEAANLFPMIHDPDTKDDEKKDGAAYRERLLRESVYRVTTGAGQERLTLENEIVVDDQGRLVDGRNRVAAILKSFGLPLLDYTDQKTLGVLAAGDLPGIEDAPKGAMETLKALAGDGEVSRAWSDADLLFFHIRVIPAGIAFDTVMNLNMARRDLTTSQRACVAANVSGAAFKRLTGGEGKPSDADIADSFGIGHKTMKRAKALKRDDKALFEQVLRGALTVGGAEAILKRAKAEAEGDDAPAPAKPKSKDAGPEVVKTLKLLPSHVRDAIKDGDNAPAELFDMIVDAVIDRFKPTAKQQDVMQEALAAAMKIKLED